jgi:hypothetical protein
MNRTCLNCGSPLDTDNPKAKYCSDKCRVNANRQKDNKREPPIIPPRGMQDIDPYFYNIEIECCYKPKYYHPTESMLEVRCSNCNARFIVSIQKVEIVTTIMNGKEHTKVLFLPPNSKKYW